MRFVLLEGFGCAMLEHLSLSLFHPQTHTERAPEDEWLDILPHPVFSPDGDSFMLLAAIQETNTEHFTHIKHVTITQQRISVISHGRYEVSERAGLIRLSASEKVFFSHILYLFTYFHVFSMFPLPALSLSSKCPENKMKIIAKCLLSAKKKCSAGKKLFIDGFPFRTLEKISHYVNK